MSEDLIRRSDAIKAIEELPNAYNGWSDTYDKAYIIGTLEEVPSADRPTGWIPVSERLPDDGRYLVTYPLLLGDDLWVSTAWYGTPLMPSRPVKDKCFYESDSEWGDVPCDDVFAWMPLPEPWKGADDE